jgi:hypothetical protein
MTRNLPCLTSCPRHVLLDKPVAGRWPKGISNGTAIAVFNARGHQKGLRPCDGEDAAAYGERQGYGDDRHHLAFRTGGAATATRPTYSPPRSGTANTMITGIKAFLAAITEGGLNQGEKAFLVDTTKCSGCRAARSRARWKQPAGEKTRCLRRAEYTNPARALGDHLPTT